MLIQTNTEREMHIVSMASRVLTQTERQYSVTEQELLAIVYTLEKFRNYIFGHEVYLCTDNKALSFLNKCALTSNGIARWVMQIQEYNLHIQNIRGTENFLAEMISQNPAGMSERDTKELLNPPTLMVAAIELCTENSVERSLKELAKIQARDKRIQEIIRLVEQEHLDVGENIMVEDGILYSKNNHNYPYWRPVLPTELETPVIQCVHTTLGHLGTEKCIAQTANTFQIKGLGQKVREFISRCDTCQWVKNPNRGCVVQNLSHFPKELGDLCAVDLFGPLPVRHFGFQYICMCFDMFLKSVKLYPLKATTIKACLNKIFNDYVVNVMHPE
jgi:hypothetical protein